MGILLSSFSAFAQDPTTELRQNGETGRSTTELRENFVALNIAQNHAFKSLDEYLRLMSAQDAEADKRLKWVLDNWVPGSNNPAPLKGEMVSPAPSTVGSHH